jgi:hypothetical protein
MWKYKDRLKARQSRGPDTNYIEHAFFLKLEYQCEDNKYDKDNYSHNQYPHKIIT